MVRTILARLAAGAGLVAGLLLFAMNPGCDCSHKPGVPPMPDMGILSVVPGSIGRFSDLATGGGRVWVSAYEETYGDLLVADVTSLPDPIPLKSWTLVDGVPAVSMPELNPQGYRGGINDPGADEGRWSSIAVTSTGNPYVAYEEYAMDAAVNPHDRGALRFADSQDGGKTWTTMTVDPGNGNPGQTMYTSISLDASGIPSIAYFQSEQPDGKAGFIGVLKYARASSPTPMSATDWTIETVDQGPQTCGGFCPTGMACLASTDQCVTLDTTPCSGTGPDGGTSGAGCASGTGCYMGSCQAVVPLDKAPELPGGAGLFAQLGFLSSGNPVIAYYDRDKSGLKVASRDPSSGWSTTFIAGGDGSSDMGQFCSLYIASDDTLNIAFQDSLADQLLFTTYKIGGTASPVVVDNGMRTGDRPHPVGDGSAIFADASGKLRILYQDDATANVMEATEGSDPTMWTTAALPQGTGMAGYGFYADLVLNGSNLVMSQYVYDRQDQVNMLPLGQLHVSQVP